MKIEGTIQFIFKQTQKNKNKHLRIYYLCRKLKFNCNLNITEKETVAIYNEDDEIAMESVEVMKTGKTTTITFG